MKDQPNATAQHVERLPDCPEFALIVGGMFKQLGGALMMGSDGKRYASRPECPSLLFPAGLPQMDGARPHEQFHSEAEWYGAMKLANFWLSRLSERDKELLFTLCASETLDTRRPFDFREHMGR